MVELGRIPAHLANHHQRDKSLSTPQRLLRRTIRNSLSEVEWEKIRAPATTPVVLFNGTNGNKNTNGDSSAGAVGGRGASLSEEETVVVPEDDDEEMANGQVRKAMPQTPVGKGKAKASASVGRRRKVGSEEPAQAPVQKRIRTRSGAKAVALEEEEAAVEKEAAAEEEDVEMGGVAPQPQSTPAAGKKAVGAGRTASPSSKRGERARSTTPRRSQRASSVKREVGSGDENVAEASVVTPYRAESQRLQQYIMDHATPVAPRLREPIKAEEAMIAVEEAQVVPRDAAGERQQEQPEEAPLPIVPTPRTGAVNGGAPRPQTSSGIVSRPLDMGLGKVKEGRISKTKEGRMNDRAGSRPRGNSRQPQTGPMSSMNTSFGSHATQSPRRVRRTSAGRGLGATGGNKQWHKPVYHKPECTGDEVFSLRGFFSSVAQFKGIQYLKENVWEPSKQTWWDWNSQQAEKRRQAHELEIVRRKAEELYRMRRAKEWREMEARKARDVEELRRAKRRKEEAGKDVVGERGELRHGGDISTIASLAVEVGSHATPQVDEGEETQEDVDDYTTDDEPAELSDTEVEKAEDLLLAITGHNLINPPFLSSRSASTSPLRSSTSRRHHRHHPYRRPTNDGYTTEAVTDDDGFSFNHSQYTAEEEFGGPLRNGATAGRQVGQIQQPPQQQNQERSRLTNGPSSYQSIDGVLNGNTKAQAAAKTTTVPVQSASTIRTLKEGASRVLAGLVGGVGIGGSGRATTTTSRGPIVASHPAPTPATEARAANGAVTTTIAPRPRTPPRRIPSFTSPPGSGNFTKEDLARHQRLRRRVSLLEAELLETWLEIEATGGLPGLKITPAPSETAGSFNGSFQGGSFTSAGGASGSGAVAVGGGHGGHGGHAGRGFVGKEKPIPEEDEGEGEVVPVAGASGSGKGKEVEVVGKPEKPVRMAMGPPPVPARK